MSLSKSTLLIASTAALFAACSTPAPAPAPAPAPVAAPAPAAAPAANTSGAGNANAGVRSTAVAPTVAPHLDPANKTLAEKSVYFEFDDYAIASQYNAIVEAHGKYLAANGALAIRVEGNADERGSNEYNLALGQRRAESVVKALKLLGVKDTQAEATSNGETKPRAVGHDEASWAQNRRADIVYKK